MLRRVVVEGVAPGLHVDGAAGAAHHNDVVDPPGVDRGVDIRLERHFAAAAQALVGGDHQLRAAVLDAAREDPAEAAEHDRMDRAGRAQASIAYAASGIIGI